MDLLKLAFLLSASLPNSKQNLPKNLPALEKRIRPTSKTYKVISGGWPSILGAWSFTSLSCDVTSQCCLTLLAGWIMQSITDTIELTVTSSFPRENYVQCANACGWGANMWYHHLSISWTYLVKHCPHTISQDQIPSNRCIDLMHNIYQMAHDALPSTCLMFDAGLFDASTLRCFSKQINWRSGQAQPSNCIHFSCSQGFSIL